MKPCCANCSKCVKTPYDIPGMGVMYGWHCSEDYLNIDDPWYDTCEHHTQEEEE